MAENYDLVILGGGTGGYVAAIRASQLGLKTAIVESDVLGGTCLHRGCIPSKALLRSAEVYATAQAGEQFGVFADRIELDYGKAHERKSQIIQQLHTGVNHLMKKGQIDIYNGFGRILGPSIFSPMPGAISVEMKDGSDNQVLIPENVIIATGSMPRSLPNLAIDGDRTLTSDDVVNMTDLPNSLLIVGGGVIGVEWASMFADFGVDVTVLEYANRLIPGEDQAISKEMQKQLKKKGVRVVTGAAVQADTLDKGNDDVSVSAVVQNDTQVFTADKLLVSVGRVPNTQDIGLQNTSIKTEHEFIQVNEYGQTHESHIYAIGDVIGGLQLAHVASHEGITAVEHIAGVSTDPVDPLKVPRCIYTRPEAASLGLTEEQAKEKGYDIKQSTFSFNAIGKALVFGEADGFAKMIVDKQTDDLLGVHMIGPHVTDMISEAALAQLLDATPWEISEVIHPHPTLSEIMGEAALAVDGNAIHS